MDFLSSLNIGYSASASPMTHARFVVQGLRVAAYLV